MKGNRRRTTNAIEVNFITRMLVIVFLIGITGLFFVYLKNQQHAVGTQARVLETQIHEAECKNESLQEKITSMTSRGMLQRRLDEGYIRLEAIRDTAIARVTPPVPAEADGVLRTASRDTDAQFGPGVSQRVMKR